MLPGGSVWFDLPVDNLADAMSFYEGLLGWEYAQMENSVTQEYAMIRVQGRLIGGLRQITQPVVQAAAQAPIVYLTVDDLTSKVKRARELGAEIIGQTVNLGLDRGHYQWIRDRAGNVVGLWAPK